MRKKLIPKKQLVKILIQIISPVLEVTTPCSDLTKNKKKKYRNLPQTNLLNNSRADLKTIPRIQCYSFCSHNSEPTRNVNFTGLTANLRMKWALNRA